MTEMSESVSYSTVGGNASNSTAGKKDVVDTDLYSRQIGAFGMETMVKLVKTNVLISGMRGVGAECAKNVILAGPRSVAIHDDGIVDWKDMGSNCFLKSSDVGKRSRAEASFSELSELNNYVAVETITGPLTEDVIKKFNVVVVSDTPREEMEQLNDFCRSQSPPIAFICVDCFGMCGRVFCDFGDEFLCFDPDGEEPKDVIVEGITSQKEGVVTLHGEKRSMPLQDGDYVEFREVQGMTELNGAPPIKIKRTGRHSFTIGDTSSYNPYIRGGIVRQVKMPQRVPFRSLRESRMNPIGKDEINGLVTPDFAKMGMSEQLHFSFLALDEWRDAQEGNCADERCNSSPLSGGSPGKDTKRQKKLPPPRNMDIVNECCVIAERLNSEAKAMMEKCQSSSTNGPTPASASTQENKDSDGIVVVDKVCKSVVEKVVAFSACQLSPMASFLGGVAAQEVLKITGKFKPLKGFFFFDCFEALNSVLLPSSVVGVDGDSSGFISGVIDVAAEAVVEDAVGAKIKVDESNGESGQPDSNEVLKRYKKEKKKKKSDVHADDGKRKNGTQNEEKYKTKHTVSRDEYTPQNSRYDDQIVIFGRSFQQRLSNLNLFVVGAGALGCEFLKAFALMGCGCTPGQGAVLKVTEKEADLTLIENRPKSGGRLIVTDMDRIEVSNLNRQFLFRRHHVGKPKAATAAESSYEMNRDLKVISLETPVGADTENIFDDAFWEGLDLVVNALDNVKSRQYVDGRCVWYTKPLMESGTLGGKANVQVILPNRTQSYSDSQDPPEESIPLCTLKHFPYQIEHTIEWARDSFQGMFSSSPQEALNFTKNRDAVLKRISKEGTPAVKRERLQKILDICTAYSEGSGDASGVLDENKNFDECVNRAVCLFQEYFRDQIAQLLHNFPVDHVNSNGLPFWSGPKRAPAVINFDSNNELHLDFVVSAANLFAFNGGIPSCSDRERIRSVASKIKCDAFKPKEISIKVDEKDSTVEGCDDDEAEVEKLSSLLASFQGLEKVSIHPVEFEKDDDTNFHIDFITACANLRAKNYSIENCDRHKTKLIAGKIVPAIATTTAMVTGLVCVEVYKILDFERRKLSDFKNAFVNLALPLWLFSEPSPPIKTVDKDYDPVCCGPVIARPNGFTSWEKLEVKILDGTIQQLNDLLNRELDVDVSILAVGNVCLYNSFLPNHKKDRVNRKIAQLYEEITKQTIPKKRKYVVMEASCADVNDMTEVVIPTIKFQFR